MKRQMGQVDRRKRIAQAVLVGAILLFLSACSQQANQTSHIFNPTWAQNVWAGFWQGLLIYLVLLYQLIVDLCNALPGFPHFPTTDLYQSGRGATYDLPFAVGIIVATRASSWSLLKGWGLFRGVFRRRRRD